MQNFNDPRTYEKDYIPEKSKYVICYSSPFWWLYDEFTNKLIKKSRDEQEIRKLKTKLEGEKDE